MGCVVNSCHCPCDADTQENIDGVTARHVADTRIRIFVLNGCHLTCERICEDESKLEIESMAVHQLPYLVYSFPEQQTQWQ